MVCKIYSGRKLLNLGFMQTSVNVGTDPDLQSGGRKHSFECTLLIYLTCTFLNII